MPRLSGHSQEQVKVDNFTILVVPSQDFSDSFPKAFLILFHIVANLLINYINPSMFKVNTSATRVSARCAYYELQPSMSVASSQITN